MRADVTFDELFSSVHDSHECKAGSYSDLNDLRVPELLLSLRPHLIGVWHTCAEVLAGVLVQATGGQ